MQSEQDTKEIFELYDKDADNEITSKEAILAARALGATINPATKTVTYQQFLALVNGGTAINEDEATKKFRLFDHDNDGSITTEELKSLLKGINSEFPNEKIDQIIASADTTKSGKVSLEQFKAILKQ
jgi:Ca2+-binding EF-hand superfamily protein